MWTSDKNEYYIPCCRLKNISCDLTIIVSQADPFQQKPIGFFLPPLATASFEYTCEGYLVFWTWTRIFVEHIYLFIFCGVLCAFVWKWRRIIWFNLNVRTSVFWPENFPRPNLSSHSFGHYIFMLRRKINKAWILAQSASKIDEIYDIRTLTEESIVLHDFDSHSCKYHVVARTVEHYYKHIKLSVWD